MSLGQIPGKPHGSFGAHSIQKKRYLPTSMTDDFPHCVILQHGLSYG